jgi:hypothetical protein
MGRGKFLGLKRMAGAAGVLPLGFQKLAVVRAMHVVTDGAATLVQGPMPHGAFELVPVVTRETLALLTH